MSNPKIGYFSAWTRPRPKVKFFSASLVGSTLSAIAASTVKEAADVSITTLKGGAREETFNVNDVLALGGSGIKASATISAATIVVRVKKQSDDSTVFTFMNGTANLTTSFQSWAALATAIGGGAASSWSAATPAGDYYVEVSVSHGDLAINPTAHQTQFVVVASVDTTAPSPSPIGAVQNIQATSFDVKVTRVSGEAGTTLKLKKRATGTADAFVVAATDSTPAVGDVLSATGLAADVGLEWLLTETDASGNEAFGSWGYVRPISISGALQDDLIRYSWLAVYKKLKEKLPGTMRIDLAGMRESVPATVEEWVEIHPIGVTADRTPKGAWRGHLMFQVGCFSHLAEGRSDADMNRPSGIAALVHEALDRQDLDVRDFALSDGSSTVSLGIMNVPEGWNRYLSHRIGDIVGLPGSLGVGLPLNIHAVIVTYRAFCALH